MIYQTLLLVHSWMRWAVLLATLFLLVRTVWVTVRDRDPSTMDHRLTEAFDGSLKLQFVLGVALYLLSPLVRNAWSDVGLAMGSAPLRFFMVEHQFAALIAVGVGTTAASRARRAGDERGRRRAVLVGAGLCAAVLMLTVPWPFLPYGRALFRLV